MAEGNLGCGWNYGCQSTDLGSFEEEEEGREGMSE